MPRYRKRSSEEDDATPEGEFHDLVDVENRRREPFPEEFPEGSYGFPPDPGGSLFGGEETDEGDHSRRGRVRRG